MAATDTEFIARPFAGLPGEADWIALSEVVPAATATARLAAGHGGGEVKVVTLLPRIRPAWKGSDGAVFLALQSTFSSGDASRDLAQALEAALAAPDGTAVEGIDIGVPGPRLQDLLDLDAPFEVSVHPSFAYWEELDPDNPNEYEEAVEQASKILDPTAAVPGLAGGYWTVQGGRPFLRWSLGLEQDPLLDALARLHAQRASAVMDGARYTGAFRAKGLLIPVWELPAGTEADDVAAPASAFRERLDAALAAKTDLSVPERRARAGLVARSVTVR
jgi:hypothetical protein